MPSTKHSCRSNPPAARRCSASLSSISSSTPARTQFWKRRCTVWYAPYRGGKSCQGAPVRKIHSAPSKALRRSLHGLPRPSARTLSAGKRLSTIFHCSSVKRIPSHSTLTLKVQAPRSHLINTSDATGLDLVLVVVLENPQQSRTSRRTRTIGHNHL